MPRSTWIFAGLLSLLVVASIGILQIRTASRARQLAEAEAETARQALEVSGAAHAALAAELETVRSRAAELEEAVARAEQNQQGLEQQLRSELESRDVTISELQGRLTVNILDRVLFDSGESRLKPEGEDVLRKVAEVLTRHPKRAVQVVGHTDNAPIRGRTAEGYTDNWALSAGRAVAAVRFLSTAAGVDPQRLSAVGCGEFHPLASNDTTEGRSRNRRIAVVVLPEEFGAPDVRSGTNAPPVIPPEPPPAPVQADDPAAPN
ncbi:MAG: OmpA family protein [Verrucomicrobiae bacterium]|nr:OmpA family protein [Verrucomicrobiae bacterium]